MGAKMCNRYEPAQLELFERDWAEYERSRMEYMAPAKQQTTSSRRFGAMISATAELGDAVAFHVDRAAAKLREQASVAGGVYVFVCTNRFRTQDPQYSAGTIIPLADPSDDTLLPTTAAHRVLRRIY